MLSLKMPAWASAASQEAWGLTQIDKQGQHHALAYTSLRLQKHDGNYMLFILEMQAAVRAMDHFHTYLKGRNFLLFTDHRPLEKLGKVHINTLNHLQEMMNRFDYLLQEKFRNAC